MRCCLSFVSIMRRLLWFCFRWFCDPVALRRVCKESFNAERWQRSHLFHRAVHRPVRLHRNRRYGVDFSRHCWTLSVCWSCRYGTWSISLWTGRLLMCFVKFMLMIFLLCLVAVYGPRGQPETLADVSPAEFGPFKRLGHFVAPVFVWRSDRRLTCFILCRMLNVVRTCEVCAIEFLCVSYRVFKWLLNRVEELNWKQTAWRCRFSGLIFAVSCTVMFTDDLWTPALWIICIAFYVASL